VRQLQRRLLPERERRDVVLGVCRRHRELRERRGNLPELYGG
jgi:hypothetical protein